MKNKKKIIVLGLLISLICISLLLLFINNDDNKSKKTKISNKIINKINEEEDALIYITDSKNCAYNQCEDTDPIIEIYKKVYELDFSYFDIAKTSLDDLNELLKYLGYENNDIVAPAVIYVKNKTIAAVANQIILDDVFREYLFDFDFLNNKYKDDDKIINLKEFQNKFSSNKANLILFHSYSLESYAIRKTLLDLSYEYNFDYNIILYDLDVSVGLSEFFENKFGDDGIRIPALTLVSNGDFIDYTDNCSRDEIISLLKDNNLIS